MLASAIFRLADTAPPVENPPVYLGKSGVSWVLRLGGLFAFVSVPSPFPSVTFKYLDITNKYIQSQFGVLISRRVPPTETEKGMRRRLAEMREQQKTGGVSP